MTCEEPMNRVNHRKTYGYEEKLAAVQAHLEQGQPVLEAMKLADTSSKSAFFRWCSEYREGGAEALRPRKRGRRRKPRP
jgi:transposase